MGRSLKDVIAKAHGIEQTRKLDADHQDKVFKDYVLPHHNRWMSLPEEQRFWTPEAVEFAAASLRGDFKHPRGGRISPSSMGDECERLLLFGFGGAPKLPFPKANAEKMAAGEFHHLRWQMEGLSAGYMTAGEVWLHSEALRCGGSADGRLVDGSLFELKSTASHLYKGITTGKGSAADYGAAMHAKHKLQMEAYWLVDEVGSAERGEPRQLSDMGSLLYQDAGDPSQLYEYRMHSSPARRKEVHRILEGIHDWVDLDQLPDMLDACRKVVDGPKEGEILTSKEVTIYDRCPYREHCPSASSVTVR